MLSQSWWYTVSAPALQLQVRLLIVVAREEFGFFEAESLCQAVKLKINYKLQKKSDIQGSIHLHFIQCFTINILFFQFKCAV